MHLNVFCLCFNCIIVFDYVTLFHWAIFFPVQGSPIKDLLQVNIEKDGAGDSVYNFSQSWVLEHCGLVHIPIPASSETRQAQVIVYGVWTKGGGSISEFFILWNYVLCPWSGLLKLLATEMGTDDDDDNSSGGGSVENAMKQWNSRKNKGMCGSSTGRIEKIEMTGERYIREIYAVGVRGWSSVK